VSNDVFPTQRFPAADEAARQARRAYRDHLGSPPDSAAVDRELHVRRETRFLDGPDSLGQVRSSAGHGAAEVEALRTGVRPPEDPLATDREDLRSRRAVHALGLFLLGTWLCSAAAVVAGAALAAALGWAQPVWLYQVLVAAGAGAFVARLGYLTARALQLRDESRTNARDIPPLGKLADAYAHSVLGAASVSTLAANEARRLAEKLEAWKRERLSGLSCAQIGRELAVSLLLFGGVLVPLALSGYAVFGTRPALQFVLSSLCTVLPAVLLVRSVLATAPHTLQIPEDRDLREAHLDAVARAKGELLRLGEERDEVRAAQQAELRKRDRSNKLEAHQEKLKVSAVVRETFASWEQKRKDLFEALKAALGVWEAERGFTAPEWALMLREQKYQDRLGILLLAATAVTLIFVTYPAAIAVCAIFGMQFQYLEWLGGLRASIIWSLAWTFILIYAEVTLVKSLVHLAVIRYQRRVLESGYELGDRKDGLRNEVCDEDEAGMRRRGPVTYLVIAVCLIAAEFGFNVAYMAMFSDSDAALRYLLPIVPSLAFLLLTKPLVDYQWASFWLRRALGRKLWQHPEPEEVRLALVPSETAYTVRTVAEAPRHQNGVSPVRHLIDEPARQ